jgi:hypothetical protein
MSVVSVNVGGQTVSVTASPAAAPVPVNLTTYQFGDMSASASVAAAVVSIAASTATSTANAALTAADAIATAADAVSTAADVVTASALAVAASDDADSAAASLASTQLAAVTDGIWGTATAYVPRGITGHGAITGGSGGTDGTFAFSTTGGNFSVAPTGTFTVSGGALTAITITGPGEYIGASPSVPTLVLTASAGLTGASATLTADFLVASGRTYLANHASNASLWQVYQNVAGVATIKTGSTFVKAPATTEVPVYCEYVAASSWETANKYFIRPIHNVLPGGDLTAYRWQWEAPFNNIAGSYNVHIVKYGVTPAADGTITAGQSITGGGGVTTGNGGLVAITARDGATAPAVGDITQYSTMNVRRNAATGTYPGSAYAWRIQEPTDRITAAQSKVVACLSETPQSPSTIRPFRGIKTEANTIFCDVYPHADHYSGDEAHYHGDVDRFVLFNYGEAQGIESAPVLNSHVPRRYDAPYSLWNFTVTGTDAGNPFNTGLSPSTVETVLNCGVQGGAAPSLAGRGHGHETADSGGWSLVLTKNDASTGDIDSASGNLAAVPVNYRFEGDKLVSTWTGFMQTPAPSNAFKTTYVHTFSSTSLYSVNVQMTMDETDAGVTDNIMVRNGSYACMLPVRNATRMRGLKVTPATGAVTEYGEIVTVNLRDASTIVLNKKADGVTADEDWNAVEAWHHRRPLVRTRLVNNAGPGYTHWVGAKTDGNRVARTGPWFVINNTWGSKAYDHIFADTTSAGVLFTGILRTDFSIYAVFGDDPEA